MDSQVCRRTVTPIWQAELGSCYLLAKAWSANYELAEDCFRKADAWRNGEALAEYHLGRMYANGWGVARDLGKAIAWYQKAADHNFAPAQYRVGRIVFR